MGEAPPSPAPGMGPRPAAAATPAGTSFLPPPPTDVLPLDTSPESLSAPGLAYSSVSSTPDIGTQCPARTSTESNRNPSRPCRPHRPPPRETTIRPFARTYGATRTQESCTSAPIG